MKKKTFRKCKHGLRIPSYYLDTCNGCHLFKNIYPIKNAILREGELTAVEKFRDSFAAIKVLNLCLSFSAFSFCDLIQPCELQLIVKFSYKLMGCPLTLLQVNAIDRGKNKRHSYRSQNYKGQCGIRKVSFTPQDGGQGT